MHTHHLQGLQPSQGPCPAKLIMFQGSQALHNTHLAPKMSFFARSMPETTFTLRTRDSSCDKNESGFNGYSAGHFEDQQLARG